MPDLHIRIKKNADGSGALTCTRADGTVTWQRQQQSHGPFFALHDLTHFAVETVLQHQRGFYGLVADGWNLTDFGAPWPRGPMPLDTNWSELIVGFLDGERAAGVLWTADDFNERARLYFEQHGTNARLTLTDDQLNAVRDRRRELFSAWSKVAPGDAIELTFDRASFAR